MLSFVLFAILKYYYWNWCWIFALLVLIFCFVLMWLCGLWLLVLVFCSESLLWFIYFVVLQVIFILLSSCLVLFTFCFLLSSGQHDSLSSFVVIFPFLLILLNFFCLYVVHARVVDFSYGSILQCFCYCHFPSFPLFFNCYLCRFMRFLPEFCVVLFLCYYCSRFWICCFANNSVFTCLIMWVSGVSSSIRLSLLIAVLVL